MAILGTERRPGLMAFLHPRPIRPRQSCSGSPAASSGKSPIAPRGSWSSPCSDSAHRISAAAHHTELASGDCCAPSAGRLPPCGATAHPPIPRRKACFWLRANPLSLPNEAPGRHASDPCLGWNSNVWIPWVSRSREQLPAESPLAGEVARRSLEVSGRSQPARDRTKSRPRKPPRSSTPEPGCTLTPS